jgi:hypothetical protein
VRSLALEEDGVRRDEAFCFGAARVVARDFVGPFEQPVQVGVSRGWVGARVTNDDLSTCPVDGDECAFGEGASTGSDGRSGNVDGEVCSPHDGGLTHRPRDDGSVAGRTAASSYDPCGGSQAVHVERGGFWTHQDD